MSDRPRSAEYEKHIGDKSPEWLALRDFRQQIDGYRCVCCGRPVFDTKWGHLQLHHIRYGANLLDPKTVISVCGPCHAQLEGKMPPHPSKYNPNTPEAQARLREQIAYTDKLIDAVYNSYVDASLIFAARYNGDERKLSFIDNMKGA